MNKIIIKPNGVIDKFIAFLITILWWIIVVVFIGIMISTIWGPNFENNYGRYEEYITY